MQIWVQKDGQNFGPFSPEDLTQHVADGAFSANDIGWFEGSADWIPLNQIPCLSFSAPTPQVVDPEPHANNAVKNREDIAQLRFDLHRVKAELEEVRSKESTVRQELEQEKQQAINDRRVSEQTILELNEQVQQHTATDQTEIGRLKQALQSFQNLQMEPPEIIAMANKLQQLEALLSGTQPSSATQQSPQEPGRITLPTPEPVLGVDTEAPNNTSPPPSEVLNPLRIVPPSTSPPPPSTSPPPPSATPPGPIAPPQRYLFEAENPAPAQLTECGERTYPSLLAMIEAASGGQIILGIFTAAATTLDVKSEELLYGRKLTFKEKYLGTMDQMKGAIVFFVYFGIILLIFMFIPEPLNEILAEVLGGIGAVVGAIYFYLKGGRKFPDVLIISDHDCVILKGIHWNKNDQLHRFEDGVKIIRNHATIKTHGFTKVIEIIVYSAEKGLFGNQKKDVTVTLRQSSRSLKKGRKELGDQLLEFQQAKEILDRLPKSVWHPS